jgi:hypothetical protein
MRSYREPGITYIGLSSETKPTTGIIPGTKFIESNTGQKWIYDGTNWVEDLTLIYALSQVIT